MPKPKQKEAKGKKAQRARSERFVSPVGIISFPHIYEPDTEGQYADEKYKATLLVDKTKEDDIKKMKQVVLKTAKEEWGDSVKYSELEVPFHDGDEKADTYDENQRNDGNEEKVGNFDNYRGKIHFTAKSKRKPGIIGLDRKPLEEGDEIKGGDFVRISLSAFAYERPALMIVDGKKKTVNVKGISLNLENIQKVKTGERFEGSSNPEGDFEDDIDESELFDDELDEAPKTKTSAVADEVEDADELI